MSNISTVPLFIGGEHRQSKSGATYDVINPATGKVYEHAAAATAEDVKEAIDNANEAFKKWQFTPPAAKAAIFRKAADLVASEEWSQKIVPTVVNETGCIASWAKVTNVDLASKFLLDACDMAYAVKGEILPSDFGALSLVQMVPMGVVFIMAPWNAPVGLVTMTVIPCLAAGNTVILKTSESSPYSQLLAAKLLKEAGLPNGVLNVVHTSREDSGPRVSEIIAHPAVRKIGFTGSDRVGRILAAEAAKYLKPCVFELGGKAPSIVLNDANLDAAAKTIIAGSFTHSGQICVGTERVIVQRGVSEQLISRLKAAAVQIKAGDQSTGAQLGCVFSAASATNIISMISEAVSDGAQLLTGDLKANGAFVQPHIVLGAKPGHRLWDRESFGPVFTIAVVDTVDEAIEMANASSYSLSSALWTSDMHKALELARRIYSGKVIVNGTTIGHESRYHQSGWGGSSGYGMFDVHSFVNKQLVQFNNPETGTNLVGDL